MSTYSEWHREQATKYVALRRKVEATGDTDLMGLLEDRDMLWMAQEEGREIRGEWASQARTLLADQPAPGCSCDICAISHALDFAVMQLVPIDLTTLEERAA